MTGPDEILKAAEELEAELANAHVQQKVVQPRTQEQTERILALARKLIDDVKSWEQTQARDERFLAIVEELRSYTAMAHERLAQVEGALGHDGTSPSSPVDEAIVDEGRWLSAMLAGPPTPAAARRRLRDGSTKREPTTLERLVETLRDDARPQQKRRTGVDQKSRRV